MNDEIAVADDLPLNQFCELADRDVMRPLSSLKAVDLRVCPKRGQTPWLSPNIFEPWAFRLGLGKGSDPFSDKFLPRRTLPNGVKDLNRERGKGTR